MKNSELTDHISTSGSDNTLDLSHTSTSSGPILTTLAHLEEMIQFEFIFVGGIREKPKLHSFAYGSRFLRSFVEETRILTLLLLFRHQT